MVLEETFGPEFDADRRLGAERSDGGAEHLTVRVIESEEMK